MVKAKLRHEWKTAREIAKETNWPWRVVARALKRMAARGEIEMDEKVTVGSRWRVRRRPCYKMPIGMVRPEGGPSWFISAAGFGNEA